MMFFTKELLVRYQKNDYILDLLNRDGFNKDDAFESHRWLLASLPKRMIYAYMYGDMLLKNQKKYSILDVGGGYSALSRILLDFHDYHLLDIMAHDNHEKVAGIPMSVNKSFWLPEDWYELNLGNSTYDIIIANDIFPNVDQRLSLFLDKFLPVSKQIRISLTYYNQPRFYKTRRVDAEEILFVLAWNGMHLSRTLTPYASRIINYNPELFNQMPESIFDNKRTVMMITLSGDLADGKY